MSWPLQLYVQPSILLIHTSYMRIIRTHCKISPTRIYQIVFLSRTASSLRAAAGRFSRFRLQGTQEAHRNSTTNVWGNGRAPWRVFRGVSRIRGSWPYFKGFRSAASSRAGPWKPTISDFRDFRSASPHRLPSSFLGGNHGTTTAAALQALSVVTATDGAWARVCAIFPNSFMYNIQQ